MDLSTAKNLAITTMAKHGLSEWDFSFTNSQIYFGSCSWSRKLITLSAPLASVNSEKRVMNTILHEIAHALTPNHHHDEVWASKAREIGCTAKVGWKSIGSGGDTVEISKFTRTCRSCGHELKRNSRPSKGRAQYCTQCQNYDESGHKTFIWRQSDAWKAVAKFKSLKTSERVCEYMEKTQSTNEKKVVDNQEVL